MSAGVILLVSLFGWMLHQHFRLRADAKSFRRWAEADRTRDAMVRKFFELVEDPLMTSRKWKEWLPIFEEMDQYYAANNTMEVKVRSLATLVQRMI